jgi:hypothetical protein
LPETERSQTKRKMGVEIQGDDGPVMEAEFQVMGESGRQ